MLIGILSDSHGRVAMTARAVQALLDAGAEMLVHLGDLEREQVIDELVGHHARIVFGNCDWDVNGLTRYARNVGVTVDDPLGRLEIGERVVAYTHGHIESLMKRAIADGADYLLHGHTHEVRDEQIGSTRVINPGALFRATRYTAAVLDPEAETLQVIELPRFA